MIFEVNYSSKNGPTELHGIKIKSHSPIGSLELRKEGHGNQLNEYLNEIQEDLKGSESDTLRCDKMYVNNFFSLCDQLGCEIEGSEEEKQEFLKKIEIEAEIKDATLIMHDDCGAEIWKIAVFRDSKNYYNIQCVRNWPGYEP